MFFSTYINIYIHLPSVLSFLRTTKRSDEVVSLHYRCSELSRGRYKARTHTKCQGHKVPETY